MSKSTDATPTPQTGTTAANQGTAPAANQGAAPAANQGTAPASGQPAPTSGQPTQAAGGAPTPPAGTQAATAGGSNVDAAVRELHQKWLEAQAYILDDPREAASRTDAMVRDGLEHLVKALDEQRTAIRNRWSNDDKLSTDELRQVMHGYRDLFRHALLTSYGPREGQGETK